MTYRTYDDLKIELRKIAKTKNKWSRRRKLNKLFYSLNVNEVKAVPTMIIELLDENNKRNDLLKEIIQNGPTR